MRSLPEIRQQQESMMQVLKKAFPAPVVCDAAGSAMTVTNAVTAMFGTRPSLSPPIILTAITDPVAG
ncbi:hypothetical protein D3P04_11600 [Paracoccus onubensis]|uniref:Uncharacterized protein n=1 Tax=Paracoccus onubensis TaxID=1675788 RepID=A0A418SVD9_9RHOB|nr:hypothetical protein D3P04_11600 [Paracoccus onubensis]